MFKKIALAAALAAMASSAFAADDRKPYAGFDFGSSKIDGFSGREPTYGAFVGYQFTPHVAVEGGYRRLADLDLFGIDLTLEQASISAIGSLPLSNRFGLYGRLGYNRVRAQLSAFSRDANAVDSTNSALFGVGATYAVSPAFVARIELQRPTSDSTNISAGIAFHF